jgi:hypothetical protein
MESDSMGYGGVFSGAGTLTAVSDVFGTILFTANVSANSLRILMTQANPPSPNRGALAVPTFRQESFFGYVAGA